MKQVQINKLYNRRFDREVDIRGPYFRDATAIIHSESFRRLKHKTQVFFAPSNDHICTRIDHVQHVASIAQTLCRAFDYDTELAHAIGLGHDLGHAPFGHVGERIIAKLKKEHGYINGFKHELNSLRTVDYLENDGEGLNLTYAVRDGIVNHCGESFLQKITPRDKNDFIDLNALTKLGTVPITWEGVSVRFSDQVAYIGRDLEDAIRLGIVKEEVVPKNLVDTFGLTNSSIINTLVGDLIENSTSDYISFSESMHKEIKEFAKFNYQNIYRSELLNSYSDYFERLIRTLRDYLIGIYNKYGLDLDGYAKEKNILSYRFGKRITKNLSVYSSRGETIVDLIYDYIAGMSDNYALACANEIMFPVHLKDKMSNHLLEKFTQV